MRLRTACDLRVRNEEIRATIPAAWALPKLGILEGDAESAITGCKDQMVVTCMTFEDDLKKGKDTDDAGARETETRDAEDAADNGR